MRLTPLLMLALLALAPRAGAQAATSTLSNAPKAQRVSVGTATLAVERTAFCGDGSFEVGRSAGKSCTGHGGVAEWTNGVLDGHVAPVAKCADSTSWYNKKGAPCRGHGGAANKPTNGAKKLVGKNRSPLPPP
ncbi:MAG: DUF3761 domain-containing protein [Gemmatimonadota bacterium]|nr:DUF3761 domain-containing protein [Gemmatimonadota bacterium]